MPGVRSLASATLHNDCAISPVAMSALLGRRLVALADFPACDAGSLDIGASLI